MAAKQPGIFVVLARCNFDDVICGAYTGTRALQTAKRRAKQVALSPELRFLNFAQANDTEFLHADVFRVDGERVMLVHDEYSPNQRKRKVK